MFLTMQAYYLHHGHYFLGQMGRQELGENYQDEDEKMHSVT